MSGQASLDADLIDLTEFRALAVERQFWGALRDLRQAKRELQEKANECKRLEAYLAELNTCLAFIRAAGRPEVQR